VTTVIHEKMQGWPVALQLRVSDYCRRMDLRVEGFLTIDLVLVLLRIGGEDALRCVQELTGAVVTKCPTAMPPWPPLPVRLPKRGPVVSRVLTPNPCAASDMRGRYALVKKGMTREQLAAKGVTSRDIRYWKDHDYIEFTEG